MKAMKRVCQSLKKPLPLKHSSLHGVVLSAALLCGGTACSAMDFEETVAPTDGTTTEAQAENEVGASDVGALVTGDFQHRARFAGAASLTGDFNGDGKDDVLILAGFHAPDPEESWLGFSNGIGNIAVAKNTNALSSSARGHQSVVGDHDGDGKDDIVSVGAVMFLSNYWVNRSNGDGSFSYINNILEGGLSSEFSSESTRTGARLLSGDFNGDGKDDLAVTGGQGQNILRLALSLGNGKYYEISSSSPDFATWAQDPNAKVVCDDFNGDGKDDIVIAGGAGWTVPVAFSNGDGSFTVTNSSAPSVQYWTRVEGAQMVTGDVDGDNDADLIFTGVPGWTSIPMARSNSNGTWSEIVASNVAAFPDWAKEPLSQARGGDFNGDGLGDVALIGGADYWFTLPIAMSNGNFTFSIFNQPVP